MLERLFLPWAPGKGSRRPHATNSWVSCSFLAKKGARPMRSANRRTSAPDGWFRSPRLGAAIPCAFLVLAWSRAGGDEVMPSDAMLTEGIPPVSDTLVAAVWPYSEARSASLLSWHPQRREMLISTRFGDT